MRVFEAIERRAQARPGHIVLSEGEDERVLRGARQAVDAGVARITLLGARERIHAAALDAGVSLTGLTVLDPVESGVSRRRRRSWPFVTPHPAALARGGTPPLP